MVVLLPKKVDGLAELEKGLSAVQLSTWLGQMRQDEVIVSLPKFKVTAEFGLKGELSKLGMPIAFTPGLADFSGMNGGGGRMNQPGDQALP